MQIINIVFRTIFFYFFITIAYRIMGKREIGQLGIIDLIVSILIAELVAISIENINDSIFNTIMPISALVLLELLLAYISIKSKKIRSTLSGKPSVIIKSGKINYQEMVRQRYSMDDLLLSLRQKSIKSIEDVEYAILEPNGKLSIFEYNFLKLHTNYPMPLILDSDIQYNTLKTIHKSKSWLLNNLQNEGLKVEDIFYAFYKGNKIFIIRKNDLITKS